MTQLLNAEIEDDGGTRPADAHRGAHLYQHGRRGRERDDHEAHRLHACQLLPITLTSAANSSPTPALIPGAIEEVLRYEAPSPVQARYVAHDTECLGESLAEGSIMLLLNGSANRDEAHFPDGERFDIHRTGSAPQLRARPALLPRLVPRPHAGARGARRNPSSGGRSGTSTMRERRRHTPLACGGGRGCRSGRDERMPVKRFQRHSHHSVGVRR